MRFKHSDCSVDSNLINVMKRTIGRDMLPNSSELRREVMET